VLALSAVSPRPSALAELTPSVVDVVARIEKARLYRGKGGEIMRSAVCRLIQCMSMAALPLSVKQQVTLLDSLDDSVKHPLEKISVAAVAGLRELTRAYVAGERASERKEKREGPARANCLWGASSEALMQRSAKWATALHSRRSRCLEPHPLATLRRYFPVSSTGPSARLHARVTEKYLNIVLSEDNAAATRGFSLALGALPSKLIAFKTEELDKVVRGLCAAAGADFKVGEEGDAETRRNCVVGLSELVKEVGVGAGRGDVDGTTDGKALQVSESAAAAAPFLS
jgi:hypothetical protein